MASGLLTFLTLITVLLTPVVPAYFGFGYEHIKVLVFLALAVLSSMVFTLMPHIKEIKWTKIKIAAGIFLIALSLTTMLGIHPTQSLTGNSPYFQGLIIYWILFTFFVVVSEVKISWQLFRKVILISALLISAIAIIDYISLNFFKLQIPSYAGRVVSTFGQPNLYSGYLLLSIPLIFERKKLNYFAIAIISIAIVLSFSRAAIAILAVLALVFIIHLLRKKGLVVFLIAVFFINVLVFSFEQSTGIIWNEIIKPLSLGKKDTGTVEKRVHILPVMFDLYLKSPVIGSGIDSISTLYAKKYSGFSPETVVYSPVDFNLKNLYIDRSHSYLLDLLIFSGILGFISYLILIFLLFKTSPPVFIKVFLILYLVWTQFQVQSIAHLMLFWLIAGLVDSKKNLKHDGYKT